MAEQPILSARTRQRSRALAVIFWACSCLVAGSPALAQNEPRPAIEPPVVEHDPGVTYPANLLGRGLRERALVSLVLELGADGSVQSVQIETTGRPEFEEAALTAARQLRFRPALRAGKAVPAKIRFRYTFEPPELSEPPPLAPAPAPAPAPPPERPVAAPEESVSITVVGEQRAPASRSFARAEVRQMPGAFGDPFRAIEAMPGVTPIASGLPFFYVRGAPPGNVGYFLDGMRVPLLYHVAIGPSVIHPGLIERVDLHSGGYPARFGRYAGGIVSAELAPPRPELHAEANLRLFDAGALVESGFGGGRGTALLAGRYSYTAALFSLAVPGLKLDYRDYQARFGYDVTRRDRVTFLALGAYDLLGEKQSGGLNVLFGTEFYRAGLRHDHAFDAGTLRSDVTFGFDQSLMGDEGKATSRSLSVRTMFTEQPGGTAQFRAGGDVNVEALSSAAPRYVDPDDPEVASFLADNPARTDRSFGAWVDLVLRVAPGFEVTPGLRADAYQQGGSNAFALEPRLAARYRCSRRLTLTNAYGLVHQPPAFAVPLPGRAAAELAGGLQQAFQTSSGAELFLGAGTKASATLFYNAFFKMTDGLSSRTGGPPDSGSSERSQGSAVGLELFVHRPLTQRLGGFLSYTLSRSMRSQGRERFPNTFDRTHVLHVALGYELGRKWRLGGRATFYSGTPVETENDDLLPAPRVRHPPRTAPFFRLDVRLEKRWNLGERSWLAFVTEVLNTTLSKEQFGGQAIGPITIPSIGLEAGY